MKQFPQIYLTALRSAALASKEIMQIYAEDFSAELKEDGSPVTQADLASSKVIHRELAVTKIPVTGEERAKATFEERKDWEFSWCVDPLDGTKEFVKKNGEFCINIAFLKGQNPQFGLIASPTKNKVIFGGKEIGVFICKLSEIENKEQWHGVNPFVELSKEVTMTCSRSHHSGTDLLFIQELRKEFEEVNFVKMGSALKFFELAEGRADVYPRFAPTMEWDIAAGQAILEALGGEVVHAETREPLVYNKSNLKNPYFIAKTKAFIEWEKQAK